jgi:hypothetical protein
VATATGTAQTPSIPALGTLVVNVPLATATAAGVTPAVQATLGAPAGQASGAAPAPQPRNTSLIPVATANGGVSTPAVAARVGASVAGSTGAAGAPRLGVDLLLTVATAAGAGQAPRLALLIGAASATGSAPLPQPRALLPIDAPDALAAALAASVVATGPVIVIPVYRGYAAAQASAGRANATSGQGRALATANGHADAGDLVGVASALPARGTSKAT